MDKRDINLYYIDMSETENYQRDSVDSNRILYTPSPFAKNSLFYLQEAGSLKAKKPHINQRNYLDSYLFLIVLSGYGTVGALDQSVELHQGECAFIDCSHSYFHQTSSDLWTLMWIHFNGFSMSSIYDKFLERSGAFYFSVSDTDIYIRILNSLIEDARSDSYVKDMLIHERISSLVSQIMKDCWKDNRFIKHPQNNQKISSVYNYLHDHFQESISLDYLSQTFFINKYYLTRLFKQQYGKTISDHLLELRINNAKKRLRFTSDSVENIAITCGFNDISYFSKKFKKAEGLSPTAFRKQWLCHD